MRDSIGSNYRLEKQEYFEDPTLPLQVCLRDPQPDFPMHSHSFNELVIILKGTAVHLIDEQEFSIRAGDVFVLSPDHEHQYVKRNGLALINVLFDTDALGMQQWDIRTLPGFHALFSLEPAFRSRHKFHSRLQLGERQLSHVNNWARELSEETENRNPGYRITAQGIFMQLVVYLSRAYSNVVTRESADLLRIGDTIAYIESHYSEKITLDALAKKSHLSERQLIRVFQECVGRSPIDYLMHVRCQKAAQLLKADSRSITEIAFECGFTDGNYFSRCFKKVMEQTPRQYRLTS